MPSPSLAASCTSTAGVSEQLRTRMQLERARRNLTRAQLADLAGTTRKSVNAIETGHMVPSTILALKLAQAFVVTVDALFYLESTPD
jgi:putative transcriptional regulator